MFITSADVISFYSTSAGIIPVILLALAFQFGSSGFRFIPEQILTPDVEAGRRTERDFWISIYSLIMLVVLVIGEIVAVCIVASGKPQPWWGAIVAASLVVGGAGLVIPIAIAHVAVITHRDQAVQRHNATRVAVRLLLAVTSTAGAAAAVYAVATPSRIAVPNVVGAQSVFSAEARLMRVGLDLNPAIGSATVDPAHTGVVVAQTPAAGTSVKQHTSVAVVVGTPASTVVVPHLTGMSVVAADSVLRALGLSLGRISPVTASPRARITAQDPAAGQRIPGGTSVNVVVKP